MSLFYFKIKEKDVFFSIFDIIENVVIYMNRCDVDKEKISPMMRQYLDIKEQYRNMKEMVEPVMHIVDNAKGAMEEADVIPEVRPIRGGTDGTDISFQGIPCPNLGTGGHNFHSIYEYITLEDMEKTSDILISIIKQFTKNKTKNLNTTNK